MTSFDEQLAQSSPAVPARSPELDAEFVRVIAQAEGVAGPRLKRRGRALTIGGLVVVGALGAGGAAAATGLVPWFESAPSEGVVTTSTGARCTLTFGVKQIDDPAAPVSAAVRVRVETAADAYLRRLDFSTLGIGQSPRPPVDAEAGPATTVDESEVAAVYAEVGRRVDAELVRQHLPTTAVSLSMATSCEGDAR
ncbi:hypothetical protein NOCA2150128 [metagenome]|uniref:Uncharacterized protein n=1 Tax=metagenome TaxID=256318 RepID=A0A2P2BXB2_9ZZZZ